MTTSRDPALGLISNFDALKIGGVGFDAYDAYMARINLTAFNANKVPFAPPGSRPWEGRKPVEAAVVGSDI